MTRFHVLLACLVVASCSTAPDSAKTDNQTASQTDSESSERWPHGAMVSAANPAAVDAAIEVLERGGHAVDAAIAAHTVLGLVEPESSGIGGSAFMLVYDRETGKLVAYDGRETSPAGASSAMFLSDGQPTGSAELWSAGVAVGVPGAVALYKSAHDDFGRLAWAGLFESAIGLALDGFEVTAKMNRYLERIESTVDLLAFPEMSAYLFPDGKALAVGSVQRNPAYASTLERIAREGVRPFYNGDIAAAIVARAQVAPMGSPMTKADMSSYEAIRRDAVCGSFRENTICSIPPPSSGLAHIMIPALYDELLTPDDVSVDDKIQVFVEAQRLAYADRDHYVADPGFVDVPVEALISPDYIAQRAGERFEPDATPEHGVPGALETSNQEMWLHGKDATVAAVGTSHLSIIDSDGNAVSMTASVGYPYGSVRMVEGFFLNNELTDFSSQPNPDGTAPANAVAPGKRPRSSMSPTIVFDAGGEPRMLTGSSGGSSIIAYTTKSILAALDWNYSAQQAADFPNIVARNATVGVEVSKKPGQEISDDLSARGYDVEEGRGENSGLHIIIVGPDGMDGAADSRRHGTVRVVAPQ